MAGSGRRNADEALALALAGGQTLRAAAAAAKVAERTATRRMADPAFRQRVAELRGDMVQRSLGRMADVRFNAARDKCRQAHRAGRGEERAGRSSWDQESVGQPVVESPRRRP
jgi:hypothetical protein